jgi:hypothetical protein
VSDAPLYLKIGGPVPLPAAGFKAVFSDTDGTLKTVDSAGTKVALGAGFGADTLVTLPNAVSTQVNALELIATLTNNGVGTEASQWDVKLLSAGAQVTAFRFSPLQFFAPAFSAAATPQLSFLGYTDSGIYMTGAANAPVMNFKIHDFAFLFADYTSGVTYCNLNNSLGVGADHLRGMSNAGNNLMFFTSDDVQIGVDGALATGATVGFLDMPSCAGAPTGAPGSVRTGKVACILDTTNFKFWARFGATWKGVVLA